MGYVDSLLEEDTAVKQPGIASQLLDEDVQRHYENDPVETSTITGKPKVNFVGKGGGGANFLTHLRAGYKYDPITKAKVYAASRFPELSEEERMSRYRYQDGEFIYKNNEGKWLSESPDLFHQKAKAILGTTHWEPVIFGTVGEMFGGPMLAGTMAGAGEAIHQQIAEAGGAKIGGVQRGTDIVAETVLGGLGSIPGRGGVRVVRKGGAALGGRRGLRIAKAAGSDLPSIDFKKAVALKREYSEKFGVDLFDAQTTESRRLLDKINLYQDMPETADLIQAAKKIQDEQAFAAVDQFWDDLAQATPAPEVGEDVVKAINSSIEKDVAAMKAKAKPLYDKAFKENKSIDISDHIHDLDEKIAGWNPDSAQHGQLVKFRKLLMRKWKDPNSGEIWDIPENRMFQLDRMKKTYDAFLKPGLNEPPITKEVKRDITQIKNNILKDIDDVSPTYAKARATWGADAQALEKLTKKTRLKYIADLEGDNVGGAAEKIFQNAGNHPEIVRKIRDRVISESPTTWNKVLRSHLETVFESTPAKLEGGADNAAKVLGSFWRKTSGTPKQRKLIAAGMGVDTTRKPSTWASQSPQFKHFEEMTDMLRRVSLVARKESTTAVRQRSMQEEGEGIARSFLKAYAYPLITYKKVVWDRITQFQTSRGRKLMAEALTNPKAQGELLRIRKMGEGTEAGLKATSTFFSLILGGEYSRELTQDFFQGE